MRARAWLWGLGLSLVLWTLILLAAGACHGPTFVTGVR